ncbi:CD3324 family protein [Anaeromicropila herbilytica]|uniref:Mor transcription activator domain-containing protein n=1 Tax=Anaeromicropila herbilytica TaxID=2785025 RepID=A0A7R7EL49_9FIRM|nr:CD3324 family protein [Anaeromicropila herbilytica]BCN30792.1 hypothetical protein bsdtb5_20870 [Anaeromicropila herbilytica]
MSYKKAEDILPIELLKEIQKYINGECLYIPIKLDDKLDWGTKSGYRNELIDRNNDIYLSYVNGISITELADRYYLSEKSIYRIISTMKKICN